MFLCCEGFTSSIYCLWCIFKLHFSSAPQENLTFLIELNKLGFKWNLQVISIGRLLKNNKEVFILFSLTLSSYELTTLSKIERK